MFPHVSLESLLENVLEILGKENLTVSLGNNDYGQRLYMFMCTLRLSVAYNYKLCHGLCILKSLATICQIRHLQSVSIFSILVPLWFIIISLVFFYLIKLLFAGFI